MSTITTLRARKRVLLMLGVTSIASIAIIIAHAEFSDFNNINQTNLSNNSAIAYANDLMIKDIKSNSYQENISSVFENSKDIPSLIESIGLPDLYKLKKVTVTATGYTAGTESTGKELSHPEYGITYSGVQVRRDLFSTIAADLQIFPLGTVLYIPNYGYGVVSDIGSAIKGNRIDLYFDTVDDVYTQWGKRKVDVYVVKYGDGFVTDNMLEQYNQLAFANLSS